MLNYFKEKDICFVFVIAVHCIR